MHQAVPVTPHWAGTFESQIPSRLQRPGKLPRPQLLPAVAPVRRRTFCTLQPSMGPPVTFQPGEWDGAQGWAVPGWGSLFPHSDTSLCTSGPPASPRLQTRGAQPPTQLPSWSCSPGQQARGTPQLHPQHPLPRTSSQGAPSPCPTLGLGLTWMWAPNQCTEPLLKPRCLPPSRVQRTPPVPFPQACSPLTSTGPIPHAKWLPWASPTPLHTLISLPPPSGFKALAKPLGVQLGPASPSRLSPRCEWREALPGQMGPGTSTPPSQASPLGSTGSPPSPQCKPHLSVLRIRVFLLINLKRHERSGTLGSWRLAPGVAAGAKVWGQEVPGPNPGLALQVPDLGHGKPRPGSVSSSGKCGNRCLDNVLRITQGRLRTQVPSA